MLPSAIWLIEGASSAMEVRSEVAKYKSQYPQESEDMNEIEILLNLGYQATIVKEFMYTDGSCGLSNN
jgi:hypothetical protein